MKLQFLINGVTPYNNYEKMSFHSYNAVSFKSSKQVKKTKCGHVLNHETQHVYIT